jgi:hypothetical protein
VKKLIKVVLCTALYVGALTTLGIRPAQGQYQTRSFCSRLEYYFQNGWCLSPHKVSNSSVSVVALTRTADNLNIYIAAAFLTNENIYSYSISVEPQRRVSERHLIPELLIAGVVGERFSGLTIPSQDSASAFYAEGNEAVWGNFSSEIVDGLQLVNDAFDQL